MDFSSGLSTLSNIQDLQKYKHLLDLPILNSLSTEQKLKVVQKAMQFKDLRLFLDTKENKASDEKDEGEKQEEHEAKKKTEEIKKDGDFDLVSEVFKFIN